MADPESGEAAALAALIAELPDDLALQALTHSSWAGRREESYERLALVGDSVLGLAVAAEVFARHPQLSSGRLTKILNQAVSGTSCAAVGRTLDVPEMLRDAEPADLGAGIPAEILLDGERPLPEVTEALIGACFLAFGFERAAAAVAAAFGPRVDLATEQRIDFKSALQELLAQHGSVVTYEVTAELGPPHERTFEVAALVDGSEAGRGTGRSKKAAEQAAAEESYLELSG